MRAQQRVLFAQALGPGLGDLARFFVGEKLEVATFAIDLAVMVDLRTYTKLILTLGASQASRMPLLAGCDDRLGRVHAFCARLYGNQKKHMRSRASRGSRRTVDVETQPACNVPRVKLALSPCNDPPVAAATACSVSSESERVRAVNE